MSDNQPLQVALLSTQERSHTFRQRLEATLAMIGATVHTLTTLDAVVSLVGSQQCDVVLFDGLQPEVVERMTGAVAVPVIVLSESPSVSETVRAMRIGAHAVSGFDEGLLEHLREVVLRGRPDLLRPRWNEHERAVFTRIVSRSPSMSQVIERLRAISATPSTTVLILGESGVGKEMIASAIHSLSERSKHRFVPVDCSAIPETMLESELFGHEKGSFTGATSDHVGRFELADGGTLFLDEIGELPLAMQSKLLRALEDRQIWRVGSQQSRKVNVRVVAATNRDLREMVRAGKFRSDLYFRLSVFLIEVPPLRERGADVLHLADHFIDRFNQEMNRNVQGLTPTARARLVRYGFPGNVRELKNVVEQAMVTASGNWLDAEDLKLTMQANDPLALDLSRPDPSPTGTEMIPLEWGPKALANLEKEAIIRALRAAAGNQTRAAQLLGIQRLALSRAVQKHEIPVVAKRGRPSTKSTAI